MPAVGKSWGRHRNSDSCQVNASKPLEQGRWGAWFHPQGWSQGRMAGSVWRRAVAPRAGSGTRPAGL